MEDGTGKCLLDVISDPSALDEFLMNSNQESPNPRALSTPNISKPASRATASIQSIMTKSPASFVNSSVTQTLVRNVNGTVALPNSPRTVPTPSKGSMNSQVNNLSSVTKGIGISPANYQSKKPIPIKPKNPVTNILPNTTLSSGINIHGNVRHVTQTPTSMMSNQMHITQPAGIPGIINGIDTNKTRVTQLQPSRTVPQTAISTPPKRIAPKQVLSPNSNSSLTMSSPVRLQQPNIPNQPNIQLATQLLKANSNVQGTATGNQLYPQQMSTVVHQVANSNQGTTMVKSPLTTTVQPVQQIQQLIKDKLSPPQTQPAVTTQVQQKVLTQTQLQTALKQSQLLAQNSPGQQQNILVQQQIIKQLIQQAQLAQQQKQVEKTTHLNVQPIANNNQTVVQQVQQKQVKQVVGRTGPTTQQVTVTNPVPGNNQQIQMILPNQQVVTLTQNAVSTNQQTLNVGQNVSNVGQTSVTQNLKSKPQIQVVGSQANVTVCQPLLIVSQSGGNFVVSKNLQPSNTSTTTSAGMSVSIPLQNLINQQQSGLASTVQQMQQQQVKLAGNVLQVGQTKQVTQPSGTVLIQSQVATQGHNALGVKQTLSQPNVVMQSKPGVTTGGTTVQQLTAAQVQQLQNLGGVQKVLIIKQPDVFQKLTSQASNKPQAIQITPQQLQALQQMQNQQSTPQKLIIQSKGDPSHTSTTILTAQQIKQLQQTLQLQGGSGKIVQVPQTVLQRQTVVQQLQNTKTTSKMAHVPRILQTSGRQASSHALSKTASTIKQEPNRGIKRTLPETPEPPKVVKRIKNALYQDQQGANHPDIHAPFKSKIDAFNKLRCYHVYHDPGPTPSDIEKAEILFNTVSSQLMKRSEKMMEKYRGLILDESMHKEPSSEMVMLYRLFLADERASLAQDKKQIADELKALRAAPALQPTTTPVTKVLNSTKTVTVKTEENITQTVLPKPKTPPPPSSVLENNLNSSKKELDILNTSPLLSAPEQDLLAVDDEESDVEMEENEIDKAVFNMESSSSYYEPINHISHSLVTEKLTDSPRTNNSHNDADDSTEELLIDDDAEKEDVTATLALLHSMAEELDGNIS